MKTSTVIWLIVGVFVLAGGVVFFVLKQTQDTLKDAKQTADSASLVTGDLKQLGTVGKKAWDDISSLFGGKKETQYVTGDPGAGKYFA